MFVVHLSRYMLNLHPSPSFPLVSRRPIEELRLLGKVRQWKKSWLADIYIGANLIGRGSDRGGWVYEGVYTRLERRVSGERREILGPEGLEPSLSQAP